MSCISFYSWDEEIVFIQKKLPLLRSKAPEPKMQDFDMRRFTIGKIVAYIGQNNVPIFPISTRTVEIR